MKSSFSYIQRGSILITTLTLIILTFSFPSHTQTPVSRCNWKVQFCGPNYAPATNNINFLLRLIESLPTTNTQCPTGQVINGFNEDGTIRCSTNRGTRGYTGVQGTLGTAGPQGDKGDPGPQGLRGLQGLKGDRGDKGSRGHTGSQGATGPQGPSGSTGSGTVGPRGTRGYTGVQGPQGVSGTTGLPGPQGLRGLQGLKGDRGSRGYTGATGSRGLSGTQGPRGYTGTAGLQGPSGLKGDSGSLATQTCPSSSVMVGIGTNGTIRCVNVNTIIHTCFNTTTLEYSCSSSCTGSWTKSSGKTCGLSSRECCYRRKIVLPPSINGQCGTIKNTCTAGISNDTADTSSYRQWKCTGQNGGSSKTCREAKASCTSTAKQWISGSNTCSATLSSANSGSTSTATDSAGPTAGSATYTCSDGVWSAPSSKSCQPNTLYGGKALSQCTNKGGRVVTVESSKKICKLSGSSCPSGWTQYKNYSSTRTIGCRGGCCGRCPSPRSCDTGSHSFSDERLETCTYYTEWRRRVFLGMGPCKGPYAQTCSARYTEVGCY